MIKAALIEAGFLYLIFVGVMDNIGVVVNMRSPEEGESKTRVRD